MRRRRISRKVGRKQGAPTAAPQATTKAGGPRTARSGQRVLSATAAARAFSHVLNRVHYRGETFIIERGGKPIAWLTPAPPTHFSGADFATLMRELPAPDDEYLEIIEKITRNQSAVQPPPWES